jgi:hypothetical protein
LDQIFHSPGQLHQGLTNPLLLHHLYIDLEMTIPVPGYKQISGTGVTVMTGLDKLSLRSKPYQNDPDKGR